MAQRIEAVLCYLVRGDQICLARKKKKIGIGRWNGYGGKIEEGQTREEAVVDELQMECGVIVDPSALAWRGELEFENHAADGAVSFFIVQVCIATRWDGEPQPSDEMGPPAWFHRNGLPYGEMMPADPYWLSRILRGETVHARAAYGPGQWELLRPVEFFCNEEGV
jgi:8-oxo-dGTP diphosphatase